MCFDNIPNDLRCNECVITISLQIQPGHWECIDTNNDARQKFAVFASIYEVGLHVLKIKLY